MAYVDGSVCHLLNLLVDVSGLVPRSFVLRRLCSEHPIEKLFLLVCSGLFCFFYGFPCFSTNAVVESKFGENPLDVTIANVFIEFYFEKFSDI